MSCAAPEASTSYGDDPTSLRDSAIALAETGEVRAAIPLFQAVVALDPSQPLGHSDEGVSWMRLRSTIRRAPHPRLSLTRVHATDCRHGCVRAVLGRIQARARARPGARPVAAEPERTHRLHLAHLRRPAHHARQPVALARPIGPVPSGAQPLATWRPGGASHCPSAPARAPGCRELPSLGQWASRAALASQPHRACLPLTLNLTPHPNPNPNPNANLT